MNPTGENRVMTNGLRFWTFANVGPDPKSKCPHSGYESNQHRFKLPALALLLSALLGDLTTANAQRFTIFGITNVWKYSTNCHDEDGWETSGYDDSSWESGPGGFTGGETA